LRDWSSDGGFRTTDTRDARSAAVGLATVPVLLRGALRSSKDLLELTDSSRFANRAAEGAVLRRERGGQLLDRVKWLRPNFVRVDDASWARGRPTNALATTGRATAGGS
jgi:hypothetical protein